MFVYSWNVSKDGVGSVTQVFTNSSGESVGGGGGGGGGGQCSSSTEKDELELIY